MGQQSKIYDILSSIPIKVYLVVALIVIVLIVIAMYGGANLFPKKQIVSVETIKYITNFQNNMSTIYVPTEGDSQKYTNLYIDCKGLLDRTIELTNQIANLQKPDMTVHWIVLGGYVNRDLPVIVGGGVEWMSWSICVGVAWQTITVFGFKRF